MTSLKVNKLPVFPLGLVVLPGTIQTLQIFEPRSLSMVKNCMRTDTGFVITLSTNNQSGDSFMSQGTFVQIIDFNQLPNGLLGITVKGSQKVSIKSVEQLESGLHYASISLIAEIINDQIEGNTINAKGSYTDTDGVTREFVQAIFASEEFDNSQLNDSLLEDELILGNQEFDSFERISLDSGYELNNLDSLGSSDIDYEKQPVFEDLNNQLLASLCEEPTLNTQEEIKVPI